MVKTISTHNGSKANRAHNIRDEKVVRSQNHIDTKLTANNEILIDEKPRAAYERLFGAALKEYNARQTRPERKIKDYYSHITADRKKHVVYEMIVQIGDRGNTGIDAPAERAAVKEFIAGWPKRNPNLALIGAYVHADEADGTLHAHLDYIPVASGYKNGLGVQNGLTKALGQQGFETIKRAGETAQIRWERRENQELEQICAKHGIEIYHPQSGRKHLDTPEYKSRMEILENLTNMIKDKRHEYFDIDREVKSKQEELKADVEKSFTFQRDEYIINNRTAKKYKARHPEDYAIDRQKSIHEINDERRETAKVNGRTPKLISLDGEKTKPERQL